MEIDEIQCSKFPRLNNGANRRLVSTTTTKLMDDEDREKNKKVVPAVNSLVAAAGGGGGGLDLGGVGRFYGWPSSRIVRVSRASGGKDRHSKVLTSRGLRDRRVRLSVNTAIQFYDLQDRLGYDQPSKAVEWLLKAAAASISELPPINPPFPETPRQFSDEIDSAEVEMDATTAAAHNHQVTTTANNPSGCSSTSETSKCSGVSLSRSESRIKARERAKERVAEKEKEKDHNEPNHVAANSSLNPISQTTSFTELLSGGINNVNNNNNTNGANTTNESNFFQKSSRIQNHWSSTAMDYFTSGLSTPLFSIGGDNNNHHHQYSFVPDNLVSVVNSGAGGHNSNSSEYNLNFTISPSSHGNSSSGLAGFNNRGTLQSNSSSLLPHHHLQRFPTSSIDGSGSPHQSFFIGTTAPNVDMNNHNQFLSNLQLCYGDAHGNNNGGSRHSGQIKGKGKNS